MSAYLRVLRYENFRYLFYGQAATAVGDQVVVVALALFITQRTGSPTDLGLVLGAQSLTLVALILFGGVWGDRLPRHRIMIVTDAIRCALHLVVAVLIFSGSVRIWHLVLIEALFGAARAFFQPAYTGLLPQTVPEELIQDARALTESRTTWRSWSGRRWPRRWCSASAPARRSLFDAATFLLSAVLLLRVHPRPRGRAGSAARRCSRSFAPAGARSARGPGCG